MMSKKIKRPKIMLNLNNTKMIRVKLTKFKEADNPLVPNNIEEGYTTIRTVDEQWFEEPTVGQSFRLIDYNTGRMFSTSTVQELLDSNTFRTHNSIYRWEILNELQLTDMDITKIDNIQFAGIDYNDYPDFSDAYIESADYDGVPMTDEQLDELSQDSDFFYEQLMQYLDYNY